MSRLDMERGSGARARNQARWREHVVRCAKSRLSAAAYCRRHGLNPKCFYRWRRILGESTGKGRGENVSGADEARPLFAEVRLKDTGSSGIEVCVAGGRTIRVAPGFDAATLCRVVSALEGCAPC